MTEATMWRHYAWRGHEVVVIQQWADPFGRRMIRIGAVGADERAEGMAEAEFLAEAQPLQDPP